MAEAGNDDPPFSGNDYAGGDGRDSLHNSSNEETRALLRRIETLERSVRAKSGVDLEGNEDEKDKEKARGAIALWRFKKSLEWKFQKYDLPESTYSFLITEPVFSPGFLVGAVAAVICLMSLGIVLTSVWGNTSPENRFGVPVGVSPETQMIQFLGVIIAVLIETVRWSSVIFRRGDLV